MIRKVDLNKDYETLLGWWKGWSWPILERDLLSELGFTDGVCAAFLYPSQSKICWLAWVVSDPNVAPDLRNESCNQIIEACVNEARALGFKVLYTSTSHVSLAKRFKNHKFQELEFGTSFARGL